MFAEHGVNSTHRHIGRSDPSRRRGLIQRTVEVGVCICSHHLGGLIAQWSPLYQSQPCLCNNRRTALCAGWTLRPRFLNSYDAKIPDAVAYLDHREKRDKNDLYGLKSLPTIDVILTKRNATVSLSHSHAFKVFYFNPGFK